jgi:hypothetical protein
MGAEVPTVVAIGIGIAWVVGLWAASIWFLARAEARLLRPRPVRRARGWG